VPRLVALVLLLALLVTGSALAVRGDPQKRITPADQARARAMLLQRADLGLGFRALPSSPQEADAYCKALDESDLTVTGEAESPTFQGGVEFVSSVSQVYESAADSAASWRRGTSAAGDACVREQFRRGFRAQGARLERFARTPLPRLAERSVAYRLVLSSRGVRAFLDVVALKQGRGQAGLIFGSALTPMPKDEEVRLAKAVARRMTKAMQGS
jgi:hypothetical protein